LILIIGIQVVVGETDATPILWPPSSTTRERRIESISNPLAGALLKPVTMTAWRPAADGHEGRHSRWAIAFAVAAAFLCVCLGSLFDAATTFNCLDPGVTTTRTLCNDPTLAMTVWRDGVVFGPIVAILLVGAACMRFRRLLPMLVATVVFTVIPVVLATN